MATVTITLTDTSASTGEYAMEFNVEENRIAEGQLTAAHLVGAYIFRQLRSGEMITMADQYAEEKSITIKGARAEDGAKVSLTFIDTDLDTGIYKINTTVERGDDAMYYTSVLLIAEFVIDQVQKPSFLDAMWQFAEVIVSDNDALSISNDNRDIVPTGTALCTAGAK